LGGYSRIFRGGRKRRKRRIQTKGNMRKRKIVTIWKTAQRSVQGRMIRKEGREVTCPQVINPVTIRDKGKREAWAEVVIAEGERNQRPWRATMLS